MLIVSIAINADPVRIPLGPVVPTQPNDGGRPRTPIVIPEFFIDGYTLTSGSYTLGSSVELIDENDNVVFSTYVAIEGDIELPTTLSGAYTIRVIRGDATFVGEITL